MCVAVSVYISVCCVCVLCTYILTHYVQLGNSFSRKADVKSWHLLGFVVKLPQCWGTYRISLVFNDKLGIFQSYLTVIIVFVIAEIPWYSQSFWVSHIANSNWKRKKKEALWGGLTLGWTENVHSWILIRNKCVLICLFAFVWVLRNLSPHNWGSRSGSGSGSCRVPRQPVAGFACSLKSHHGDKVCRSFDSSGNSICTAYGHLDKQCRHMRQWTPWTGDACDMPKYSLGLGKCKWVSNCLWQQGIPTCCLGATTNATMSNCQFYFALSF